MSAFNLHRREAQLPVRVLRGGQRAHYPDQNSAVLAQRWYLLAGQGSIGSVTANYGAWLDTVAPNDADDPGVRAVGADHFLREIFDWRGPISVDELDAAAQRMVVTLARAAVDLVMHDLHATTDARPVVDVIYDEEYGLIVAYNGGYSTPSMHSMQNPEATSEIGDYLQGEIADDLWTVWPTCKSHGGGLDAKARDAEAIWHCRLGDHRVAAIGQLAP